MQSPKRVIDFNKHKEFIIQFSPYELGSHPFPASVHLISRSIDGWVQDKPVFPIIAGGILDKTMQADQTFNLPYRCNWKI